MTSRWNFTATQRHVLLNIDKLRRNDGAGYRHYMADTGATVLPATVDRLFDLGLIRVADFRGARTTFALTNAGWEATR